MFNEFKNVFTLSEKEIKNLGPYIGKKKTLEIGFGNGENLINLARKETKNFFVGCEPYINGYIKIIEKIVRYDLKNIKLWPDDIRLIIKKFKKNLFDLVLILQPDPWPKKKHVKRRLIQQKFLDDINNILKPNGILIVSTDHDEMKSWILEQVHIRKDFSWCKDGLIYQNKSPYWFISTKYTKKAENNDKLVNWFFFKKN